LTLVFQPRILASRTSSGSFMIVKGAIIITILTAGRQITAPFDVRASITIRANDGQSDRRAMAASARTNSVAGVGAVLPDPAALRSSEEQSQLILH
jgi:hypothetical protein